MNTSPAAMASGGMAWSETVRLLSAGISAGCQAGMIVVAGSPASDWPFSCASGMDEVGHLSIVDVTLGAGGSGAGAAATGSGSDSGSGPGAASATTGSGVGSG